MRNQNYATRIIKTIRLAKSIRGWSRSNYLEPLARLYKHLTSTERRKFCRDLTRLLKGKLYLQSVIDICAELAVRDACPILLQLVLRPPRDIHEDGYALGTDGILREALVALGQIGCRQSVPVIERLLVTRASNKSTRRPSLGNCTYGPLVVSCLARLAPDRAAKYFGRALEWDRQERKDAVRFVTSLPEWSSIAHALPIGFEHSPFIQNCIVAVAQAKGLQGLKQWLKSVTLPRGEDQKHLQRQLEYLLCGTDRLANLRRVIRFRGNGEALAQRLASLPSIRKTGGGPNSTAQAR